MIFLWDEIWWVMNVKNRIHCRFFFVKWCHDFWGLKFFGWGFFTSSTISDKEKVLTENYEQLGKSDGKIDVENSRKFDVNHWKRRSKIFSMFENVGKETKHKKRRSQMPERNTEIFTEGMATFQCFIVVTWKCLRKKTVSRKELISRAVFGGSVHIS
jgi:hypothetical protein